ncbi:S49 family peptidase [Adonisia turfae]
MTLSLGPLIRDRVFNRPVAVREETALTVMLALLPKMGHGVLHFQGQSYEATAPVLEPGSYRDRAPRVDAFHFDEGAGLAVVPIEGLLSHRLGALDPYCGMTGYDGIAAKLRAALNSDKVRGIWLDIDSPGGEVSGCFDLVELIREAAEIKPVAAIADDCACSAAYALACAAGTVFTTRTAALGSIGVYTLHVDMSRALAEEGLVVTPIYAGARKVDGHPYAPLPEEVRDRFQAEVERTRQLFADTVARMRGLSVEAVLAQEAEVYTGADAVTAGLADAVTTSHEAYQAFAEQVAPAA